MVKEKAAPVRKKSLVRRSAVPVVRDIQHLEVEAPNPQYNNERSILVPVDAEYPMQTTENPPLVTEEVPYFLLDSHPDYVNITEHPYIVTIDVRNGNWPINRSCPEHYLRSYSKGVIVSRNYILWVGFVCPRICTYIVIVGSNEFGKGGELHRAAVIPFNETWRHSTSKITSKFQSVVLLKLDEPIAYSATVQPVKLSDVGERLSSRRNGLMIYDVIIGPEIFQKNRTLLNSRDCNGIINSSRFRWSQPRDYPLDYIHLSEELFCTIPVDGQFPVGSPGMFFFVDGKLFGIQSDSEYLSDEYGFPFNHDVMRNISYYRDFIKNHTGV
ncbi:hypothetical protein QAD02_023865 [Eretmocerus hayati]|uniref:Uncharacterized protein n=1 Tax=Eretmocerus hayati TaxID=131215 RepID=A0ACC2PXE7_9HYME|nr:hypothetical protein QAD02_023865 [Eretmocerus hayati]